MFEDWRADLERAFPGWESPEREEEWQRVRASLEIGACVEGTVVTRAEFGAWLDIGVGFPALIEIIALADLTPEHYRAGDWCRPGSVIRAQIKVANRHQIRLISVTA